LLDLAATTITAPLANNRPLWAGIVVSGLTGGRTALILKFHHAIADGVGGLAVLAQLADGPPGGPASPFPRPAPPARRLFLDALGSRLRALWRSPVAVRRLAWAVSQLRTGLANPAPSCSLNRPTGPRRRLAVARADLAAIKMAAHARGGTVNDVVLTAVTGALHGYLLARGEMVDRFVVSMPVSTRAPDDHDPSGNKTGVVPVELPARGDPMVRLEETATITRIAKTGDRGATATVVEPVFRLLSALRVVRWYIDRQRRVNTFVTNLRGPAERMAFFGASVTDAIPVNAISGNVAVAFGVLSNAGTLTVTVVADPDRCPGVNGLAARVQQMLDHLSASVSATSTPSRTRRSTRLPDEVLPDV
jgi:WS/DGAT/MGAT family acyltransferase